MTRANLAMVITAIVCAMLTTTATSQAAEIMVDKSDFSIKSSLTAQAGDPVNGRKVAISRKKGNCLACHAMPIPEEPFHGRIAPALMGDWCALFRRTASPAGRQSESRQPAHDHAGLLQD